MGQTQSGVTGDGALPTQNTGDAVGGHIQLARQFGGAHAEFMQLLGQVLAGMYRGHCHSVLLVIVDYLHVRRSRGAARPLETDPPAVVDPDAVLSFAVAGQRFETIAGQGCEVPNSRGRFQPVELQTRRPLDSGECSQPHSSGKESCALFSVADDQRLRISFAIRYVKHNNTRAGAMNLARWAPASSQSSTSSAAFPSRAICTKSRYGA